MWVVVVIRVLGVDDDDDDWDARRHIRLQDNMINISKEKHILYELCNHDKRFSWAIVQIWSYYKNL